jgi:hypothetical protein
MVCIPNPPVQLLRMSGKNHPSHRHYSPNPDKIQSQFVSNRSLVYFPGPAVLSYITVSLESELPFDVRQKQQILFNGIKTLRDKH